MKVFTPGSVAKHTDSKYLGVLVAAKYARRLNEFRRGIVEEETAVGTEPSEKLTTTSLESVTRGSIEYRLTPRRRPEI
jgi:DNA-directed RNA polymerase omega subunit